MPTNTEYKKLPRPIRREIDRIVKDVTAIAQLPYDKALEGLTNHRWRICHTEGVSENTKDAVLAVLDMAEAHIKSSHSLET